MKKIPKAQYKRLVKKVGRKKAYQMVQRSPAKAKRAAGGRGSRRGSRGGGGVVDSMKAAAGFVAGKMP